jgi:hypothetical protein
MEENAPYHRIDLRVQRFIDWMSKHKSTGDLAMKNLVYALAITAVTSFTVLGASGSASPLPGGMASNNAVLIGTSTGLAQNVSWHCWKTHRYSHRLHRYLRACGDTGKFKHRASTSAGLAVKHETVKKPMSNY